jgi:hypothetical protein
VTQKRTFLLACTTLATFYIILFFADQSAADMRTAYPTRFSFSGLIELTFKNYNVQTTSSDGRKSGTSYSTFEQKYKLGAQGFIYDPRLIVFASSITYDREKLFQTSDTPGYNSGIIEYDLSTVFLPYRPITLLTYATRYNYTLHDTVFNETDITLNQYGAQLKIYFRNLPAIRFEYWHQDTTTATDVNTSHWKTDDYWLNVRGSLTGIKTQYTLNLGLAQSSGSRSSQTFKYVQIGTSTNIKDNVLMNFFSYYGTEGSKSITFNSSLDMKPLRRFSHDYSYEYDKTTAQLDDTSTSETRQYLRGSWAYRFTNNLGMSASLQYGLNKVDNDKWHYYMLNTSLNYSKPFNSSYLTSFYRFIIRNDPEIGNLMEHMVTLDLSSWKFKWARLFVNYNLDYLDQTLRLKSTDPFSFDTQETILQGTLKATSSSLAAGLNGNLFHKATWTFQGQFIYSLLNKKRQTSEDLGDLSDIGSQSDALQLFSNNYIEFKRKRIFYVFLGNIIYPLGKGATAGLKTGYNFGRVDSESFHRMYYQLQVNYPVTRRLALSAWFRQIWYKLTSNFDQKNTEYEIIATYRLGRTYLDAECWNISERQDASQRDYRRIILKVRRAI